MDLVSWIFIVSFQSRKLNVDFVLSSPLSCTSSESGERRHMLHGGSGQPAFHVVAPSLPNLAFLRESPVGDLDWPGMPRSCTN